MVLGADALRNYSVLNEGSLTRQSVDRAISSLPANVTQGRKKGLKLARLVFVCGLDCLPHQTGQAL
jgi:hypothetical protein